MEISTPEELGKALKSHPSELIIVGDLVSDVRTIRNPSRIVWWGIAGALVTLLIIAKGLVIAISTGVGGVFAGVLGGGVGAAVVAVLGMKGTIAAVKIGNAGDGIKALNKLRAYKEVDYKDAMESKNARLVLTQS